MPHIMPHNIRNRMFPMCLNLRNLHGFFEVELFTKKMWMSVVNIIRMLGSVPLVILTLKALDYFIKTMGTKGFFSV